MSLGRDVRSRGVRLGLVTSILGMAVLAGAPAAAAAGPLTLTTPYPAVAVAPGATVTFDIAVTTATAGRVDLTVGSVPTGWTAVLRGGGFTIDGVETDGTNTPTKVTLNVTVPADAGAVTQRLTVRGVTPGDTKVLAIDIRVSPNAAGDVKLTTDVPQVKGASDASFSFSLTLTNDTPDDLPFSVAATGPEGWTVTASIGTQAQAASVVVNAGANTTVAVTAKPSADAAAGMYPISVVATSGGESASQDLGVEITGSYKLALTTGDQPLNMHATAGSPADLTLTLSNTGTADIEGAAMSATAPTGWKATFDPPTASVPAGGQVQVVAHLTPSGSAIAGDYVTTFKATAPVASATADVRVTIETSLLWGAIGVGLILLVLLGLFWTFRRFGRR